MCYFRKKEEEQDDEAVLQDYITIFSTITQTTYFPLLAVHLIKL